MTVAHAIAENDAGIKSGSKKLYNTDPRFSISRGGFVEHLSLT